MMWSWIWLGIIVVTIIIELITVGLTSIWMAGGALCALGVSSIGAPVWLQVVVFFIVTIVLLIFTRPWAIHFLNRKKIKTNIDAMVGSLVRVIERVDNNHETGKVFHNGMEWTARAMNNEDIFEPDEMAEVALVSGVKLILKKQSNN